MKRQVQIELKEMDKQMTEAAALLKAKKMLYDMN
jgi:hypothetical protein